MHILEIHYSTCIDCIMPISNTSYCIFNLQDGRVNALYSTPSIYTNAKNVANETWPLKTNDYFP